MEHTAAPTTAVCGTPHAAVPHVASPIPRSISISIANSNAGLAPLQRFCELSLAWEGSTQPVMAAATGTSPWRGVCKTNGGDTNSSVLATQ